MNPELGVAEVPSTFWIKKFWLSGMFLITQADENLKI